MCEMWCRRLMRLDKYLCKSTDLTKPEAIERIHDGKVNVNNETVTDESTQVHESNTILLNGTPLKLR
ncbi:S4 domain-containing protein, partial [Vibrio sp. 10N.261.45.A7]